MGGTILDNAKSLFYEGLATKGGLVVINKRQIESAVMTGTLSAEVKMVSGNVITLTIDAKGFGELLYFLNQVEHENSSVTAN